MKSLLFITFSLTLFSCTQRPTKALVIENFKYSAYSWHINQEVDTFEFYLAHHIDINKSGHFVLMRHDSFMDTPKYFEGDINDNLFKLIDSTFRSEDFNADYSWKVNDGFLYDGFTYCINYKKTDNNYRKKIQFIPNNSPQQIKTLITLLDNVIFQATKASDSINLKDYSEQLKQLYIAESGPLPKLEKLPPTFEPVKIK
ncbi:MAG: hypothetical protein JNL02_14310 [Saprospiraceae bacterium]|nr:hypothetical protein [Saprospiraceae bacterium]